MKSEKRQTRRVELFRSFFFIDEKEKIKHSCLVKNISITGACITSEKHIGNNDLIDLHLITTKETVIKAKVEWECDSVFGVSFILESNSDFEKISFVMNNIACLINR